MPDVTHRPDPFEVPLQSRLARAAYAAARPFLTRGLQLDALRALHAEAARTEADGFAGAIVRALGVRLHVVCADGAEIPARGPLIAAANHPTGALDGLALAEALRQVRPDVRILANHLLSRIPELADSCFFVDPFGGPDAAARSQAGLRAAHLWLRQGGALVMFPAGTVAYARTVGAGDTPADSEWHPALGRLASATGARILPCFIGGRNSRAFYAAGRVHAALRTALLGRELINKRGRRVSVAIGRPLEPRLGADGDSAAAVTARAREAMERTARSLGDGSPAAIPPPVDAVQLADDVNRLPPAALLLSSGSLEVYCAPAASLPAVLQEIGRLREITFRAVGEGTGRARDLDRFDSYYDHLFVWNRRTREIVGAYRVGATDRIVPRHGVAGLYTSTLFRYDEQLLDRLGPAFELGRSFVRAEYQRSYSALLLLWQGIGRLLTRSPRYRVLFGPVSISSRYQDSSQQLLRAFLAQHHGDPDVASLVSAVNPPAAIAPPARERVAAADVGEIDALVRRLEGSQGIPVLLRQYLRLNARLLGFNVDPAFGDALDALMMVHVDRLPPSVRDRYLGFARRPSLAA